MSYFKNGSLVERVGTSNTTILASQSVVRLSGVWYAQMPNATQMSVGQKLDLYNDSAVYTTIRSNNLATDLYKLPPGKALRLRLIDNSSANGTWVNEFDVPMSDTSGRNVITGSTPLSQLDSAELFLQKRIKVFSISESPQNSITVDFSTADIQKVTANFGGLSISFSNGVEGKTYYLIVNKLIGSSYFFPGQGINVRVSYPLSDPTPESVDILAVHFVNSFYLVRNLNRSSLPLYGNADPYSFQPGGIVDPKSGYAYLWGDNYLGRLGTSSVDYAVSPTPIQTRIFSRISALNSGAFSTVPGASAAAAGLKYSHGAGIDFYTGRIWTWGKNNAGQLGNNSTTDSYSPTLISLNRSFSQVVVSGYQNTNGRTMAIEGSTGIIWAWGDGSNGRSATNNVSSSSPITIARTQSYSSISCSFNLGAAIEGSTGRVWTWGENAIGQLGNNTTTAAISPVTIARASSYKQVVMTQAGGAAIEASTGMIWSWGNFVGDGTNILRSSPVSVNRVSSYSKIAGDSDFDNNVLYWALDGGRIYQWSSTGTYGVEPLYNFLDPPPELLGKTFIDIAVSAGCGYALDSDYVLWAIGKRLNFNFPDGRLNFLNNPIKLPNLSRSISVISSGGYNSNYGVIEASTGRVWAWGSLNSSGQLGINNTTGFTVSPQLIARTSSYSKLSVTNRGSLFLESSTGMVWGSGIGINNSAYQVSSPVSIARSSSYSDISMGHEIRAAIEGSTGMIWVWSESNSFGQLGNNTTNGFSSPVTIARSSSYSSVHCGFRTGHAIEASTGMIWAWGSNTNGRLGNNSTTNTSSPITIARTGSYSFVRAQENGGGAIDASTGMIWVWGSNSAGFLGTNQSVAFSRSSPVTIARTGSYSKLAVGANSMAALEASTGIVWAWGSNSSGAVGDYTTTSRSSPVSIFGGRSYSDIGTNGNAFFAREGSTGLIWGWGSNSSYSLTTDIAGDLLDLTQMPVSFPKATY